MVLKHGKSRYTHQTSFQWKVFKYKTWVTHDDVYIEFHQSTHCSRTIFRFFTSYKTMKKNLLQNLSSNDQQTLSVESTPIETSISEVPESFLIYNFRVYRLRSSHRRCSLKKGLLKNFTIFHRKTSVLKSLFNKVAGLEVCNCIKRRLQHRCFPVNMAKLVRATIL